MLQVGASNEAVIERKIVRAAQYVRMSTEHQRYSTSNQEDAIAQYPHTIAMEIAKAKEGEVQQALAKAYEEKAIPGNQVLAIRQIIEQRNASGKGLHHRNSPHRGGKQVTSEALIRAYQRETERQRQLVKRASLTQGRLMFVTNALKHLLADDHFVALMRAEGVGSVPTALAERISYDRG